MFVGNFHVSRSHAKEIESGRNKVAKMETRIQNRSDSEQNASEK